MGVLLLWPLFATVALGIPQNAGNFTSFELLSSTLSCEGTSTYAFTPLETVTVTVDGEYTYTGNSTPTDIYYTPPPPCSEVIDPDMSITTSEKSTSTSKTSTEVTTTKEITTIVSSAKPTWTTICTTSYYSSNITAQLGAPYVNTTNPAVTSCTTTLVYQTPFFSASLISSALSEASPLIPPETSVNSPFLSTVPASSLASISSASAALSAARSSSTAVTVTVTKKTPVPPTPNGGPTNAGPTFPSSGSDVISPNSKQTPTAAPTTAATTQPRTTNPPANGNPSSNNAQPTGGNSNNNNNNSQNNNASPTDGNRSGNPSASSSNNNNNNNNQNTNSNNNANQTPTGNGLGSLINSVFNSPFSTAVGVATSFGAPSATVTLVGGVPVQVGSSSVYIGGSNIAVPTGSSTAFVTIAGQTFTVVPSAVIGGGSTLTLQRSESVSYSPVQAATLAASTITRNGVTITVEPTAAVVSGRTFTIGLNAQQTTTVVNGQTITFNSDGIIFPAASTTNSNGVVVTESGTTYRPAITTAAAYVVTTIGQLTFSIDQSEAIISGTTYRIGAGSLNSKTTAVFDGTTVVFGPSGIVLPSTTVSPTAPELTSSGSTRTSASAATRVISGTAQATSSGGAGARAAVPSAYLSNAVCAFVMVIAAGTLPLSLIL